MRIASVAALLLVAGCSPAGDSPVKAPAANPPVKAPAGDPRVEKAAREYASYGKVDDLSRWAPTLCKAPAPPQPHLSTSRDAETHGRKLYYLYAKDREAYRMVQSLDQPVGQVLVKESWVPAPTSTFQRPVTAEQGPLFLMIKTGEADSDQGWIYATATPDGKTITSSGKLASCMECHQGAKYDRLFGVVSCAAAK